MKQNPKNAKNSKDTSPSWMPWVAGIVGVLVGIVLHIYYVSLTSPGARRRGDVERARPTPKPLLADPKTLGQLHAISVIDSDLGQLPKTDPAWNQKYSAALDQLAQLYQSTPDDGKRLVFVEIRRLIHQAHLPPFIMSPPIQARERGLMTINRRN